MSMFDLDGEETPLTEETTLSWSSTWRDVNGTFEESLRNMPEWGPFIQGKMIHVLDGNNRYKSWMDLIAQVEGDLKCFYLFIQFYVCI